MDLSLLFDAAVSLLLLATIFYAALLSRRLAALRDAKEEMAALAENFVAATAKAEDGLAELRRTAETQEAGLQQRIGRARGLSDDLGFLTERANSAADRLEEAIAGARPLTLGDGAFDTVGAAPRAAAPVREPAREKLLKALQELR